MQFFPIFLQFFLNLFEFCRIVEFILRKKSVCGKKFDDQFLAKNDKYLHNFYIINYLGPSSHIRSRIPTRCHFTMSINSLSGKTIFKT